MSDWMPTTGKVRNCYSSGRLVLDSDGTWPIEREAEFDRWLDRVKADAWDEGCAAARLHAEQERRGSETRIVLTNPYRQEVQG